MHDVGDGGDLTEVGGIHRDVGLERVHLHDGIPPRQHESGGGVGDAPEQGGGQSEGNGGGAEGRG